MADVAETTPVSAVDQSGNTIIWWVPAIADVAAPKVSEIGAVGAKRVTYSFTPDGWGITGSQEKKADARLTLDQTLEALGKSTASLTLKYVDSTDAASAAALLTEGSLGYFVERRGVSNATLVATGQKVRVIKVALGKQIPGPVDGTGKFTIMQETAITGVVGGAVAVAA